MFYLYCLFNSFTSLLVGTPGFINPISWSNSACSTNSKPSALVQLRSDRHLRTNEWWYDLTANSNRNYYRL